MTNLRQGRWLRSLFFARGAFSFTTAAVVGTGLLLPGAAWSAPHSHARRPLPTALHSTWVSDAGSQGAKRHGKGGGKAKADARPAKASRQDRSGSGSAGAHGAKRGRRRKAEPADDYVPMFHARHGEAPLERGSRHLAHNSHTGHGRGALASEPAPMVSRYDHRQHGHAVGGRSTTSAFQDDREDNPVVARSAPRLSAPARHTGPLHPETQAATAATPASKPAATVASNRQEVYAEGVSHPDDDERLPRPKAGQGDDDQDAANLAPAPVARMSAAPTGTPTVPAAQIPVVQGFGAEVAVPAPDNGANRPGGTRRRNHPPNWQPQSMVTAPEPLEEREAITEAAVSPNILPEIYDRTGHLLMPAPLKGSHDVLVHQNLMATSDGLERIYDDNDLDRLRAAHLLVSFPQIDALRINEDLPYNRRVARPWTVSFVGDIARAYYAHFRQPLWVTSAVRTVHYQARLQMVNGNAAATYGDAASPHLTGQAIDFGKGGMSHAQLAWMRGYLLPLMQSGKIDVEEEFHQACFHISVYRSYTGGRRAVREYAEVHPTQAGDGGSVAGSGTGTEQ